MFIAYENEWKAVGVLFAVPSVLHATRAYCATSAGTLLAVFGCAKIALGVWVATRVKEDIYTHSWFEVIRDAERETLNVVLACLMLAGGALDSATGAVVLLCSRRRYKSVQSKIVPEGCR